MEIKPTYTTFEQAKRFTDKGLRLKSINGWYTHLDNDKSLTNNPKLGIVIPEHWQVVEWLLQKRGIDVSAQLSFCKKYIVVVTWNMDEVHTGMGNIPYYSNQKQLHNDFQGYDSKQEAYSVAFDYVFEKLI